MVKFKHSIKKFTQSIWLFPAMLTLLLIIMSALQVSGSSIGIYHELFYGASPDKDLIANHPLSIRSDEWIVNTQKAIAQENDGFKSINKNVGVGEDETLLADTPTTDWSTLFKPHNLGFFVLPFANAFALKWWLLSYLLILSSYFFILMLLPGKKMLAALLSLAFLFSPFLQWWYSYGTLGTIYYTLFGLVAFMKIAQAATLKSRVIWSSILAYIGVCFALIFYPPFQIPCLIVALGFAVGYLINKKRTIKPTLLFGFAAMLVAALIVGCFFLQKKEVISTIEETAYPGQRIVTSGGYSAEHLLSSQLSPVFEYTGRAMHYSRPEISATNQSESSNFILLLPFILLPILVLSLRKKQKQTTEYTSLILAGVSLLFFAWLLVPHLNIIGDITLLNRVPLQRLLIGIGLVNFILGVLFIKQCSENKYRFPTSWNVIYSLLVLLCIVIINLHVSMQFPGFLGFKGALLLSLPFPIITFLFLQKYFRLGALFLFIFSFVSVFAVNPLYKGTDVLTDTPISQSIRQLANGKRWASEEIYLENFASMNGVPSLTGTYVYPQLNIWDKLNQPMRKSIYNRYAHVSFTFDRSGSSTIKPVLTGIGVDQFNIKISPCDPFFKTMNVGFLTTSVPFPDGSAPCASLAKSVTYPAISYYIYRLSF